VGEAVASTAGAPSRTSTIVFLDYQNLYMSARRLFYPPAQPGDPLLSPLEGHFDPLKLAQLLVARAPARDQRYLKQVRVYRGTPLVKQRKLLKAFTNQTNSWKKNPLVEVVSRQVRQQPTGKIEEKGIDVKLAVDVVSMAINGDYEIGILMSEDSDLIPALEVVLGLSSKMGVGCEVAVWKPSQGYAHRLNVPGDNVWCHFVPHSDYLQVADSTDYSA
jgi:uncharacterized LabA/DUF88 family protein